MNVLVPKVLESGKNYCLREWSEGVRGDIWYNQWKDFGCPVEDEGFLALFNLWKKVSDQGFYIQNLKQLNMIWSVAGWVVIDSGYRRSGDKELCMLRFCHHFDKHWQNSDENNDHTPMHLILIDAGLYSWADVKETMDELEDLLEKRKADKERNNLIISGDHNTI